MPQTHSSSLFDLVCGVIRQRGPIPFRDFMELALYEPGLGYYSAGTAAIGRQGDFFTSVSVGPLFGALLARQFAQMWESLGRPAVFELIEQGAHNGRFAQDVLDALRTAAPPCYEALRLTILENSPAQRELQAATLGNFTAKVSWQASPDPDRRFCGVHFSNELLDAFPVHLVRWNGQRWSEQYVTREHDGLVFQSGPLSCEGLRQHLELLPWDLPEGYTTEVNLAAPAWIEGLAAQLERGYILAIDYGYPRPEYYRPERSSGTLSGYSSHKRVADLLASPGEIDLTAHVDFTTVTERGEASGLQLHGYTDQHHLMVGLSSLHFSDSALPSPALARDLRAFKTLMHPTLMGTGFKALCLQKAIPLPTTLAGFQFAKNSRETLGLDAARPFSRA